MSFIDNDAIYFFCFFINNSYGTKNLAVEYGKIFMNLNELSEGASLTNLYPKTDEEGINQRTSFDFSVSGYNSGSKRLYYDIFAVQGSNISEKTRFNDNEISIYLTDNLGNILYGPSPATGLSEDGCELIKMRSILGGDDENLIIHNYILKVWLNDSVVISNTETYIPNKTIYTTSQIKNKYFSVKIKVEGYFLDEGAFQIFSDVLLEPSNIKGTIAYGAPGNEEGLYYWEEENKYIYRGGLIKINSSGLDVGDYENDTDDGDDIDNYVKVPWETYGEDETCEDKENNKCWRIVSVNADDAITIIRDRNRYENKEFDMTHNSAASAHYEDDETDYGYNDLLANPPTPGHPEEYRPYSLMYILLYGENGYQNTELSNYFHMLQTIDVCLNKVDDYRGINYSTYSSSSGVKDTCNVIGKPYTLEVPHYKINM